MIHVSEINDASELASNRLLWESLWQRTRDTSYFQSFDWFDSYRRHFGRSQQLKVLVARLAGKPIGIMPLVIRNTKTSVGTLRALCFPQTSLGSCTGPIGPNSAATLIATTRYLRDSHRDWDICDLHPVDVNRRDRGRTRNALRAASMKFRSNPEKPVSVVDFDSDWNSYWSDRSVEARRRFHQVERQMKMSGNLTFLRVRPETRGYADVDCRWDLFDEFLQTTGSFDEKSSKERAFFRELHSRAVHAAKVDMGRLMLDGQTIAVWYGYVANGCVDVVRVVNNSEYGDDASQVLTAMMLRDGAMRGDSSYRFASESSRVIADFQTGEVVNERLTHFAPAAPKAQLLRWNHGLQTLLGRLSRVSAALNL